MAKLIKHGDTIIAKHTDGHTRRYNWKGLKKHPVLNKNMTLYECDMNSYAEIVKECDETVLGQVPKTYNKSTGDCISADAISIYIDSNRKQKFDVESGTSGRHSSNTFNFRKLSICTIKIPLKIFEKHLMQASKKIKTKST